MGSKGNNRHVKRLASSRYMKINRKSAKFVTKPAPGRHTRDTTISLITLLKEKLGVANNSKEARSILKSGSVSVNGKAIKEEKYPIGIGDAIHLQKAKESYRVVPGSKGVFSIDKAAAGEKQAFKVLNKYTVKGNKIMIQLNNGNVIASDNNVKVNDSVVLEKGKVSSVIRFATGSNCLVVKGIHAPATGKIKGVKPGTSGREALVEIEGNGASFETAAKNVMVVE